MATTLSAAFAGYEDAVNRAAAARSAVVREKPTPSRRTVQAYGASLDAVERSIQTLLGEVNMNRNQLHAARLRVAQMLREDY